MGSRIVDIYLIKPRLINLDLSVGKNHYFGAGLHDFSRHLGFTAGPPKVNLSLLSFGNVVNDLVVLRPCEVCFCSSKLPRGLIHLLEHGFEFAGWTRERYGCG